MPPPKQKVRHFFSCRIFSYSSSPNVPTRVKLDKDELDELKNPEHKKGPNVNAHGSNWVLLTSRPYFEIVLDDRDTVRVRSHIRFQREGDAVLACLDPEIRKAIELLIVRDCLFNRSYAGVSGFR